jgi:hypothetical protein
MCLLNSHSTIHHGFNLAHHVLGDVSSSCMIHRYKFSSKESNEAALVFNRSAGAAAAATKRKAPQASKKKAAAPRKAKKKRTK